MPSMPMRVTLSKKSAIFSADEVLKNVQLIVTRKPISFALAMAATALS